MRHLRQMPRDARRTRRFASIPTWMVTALVTLGPQVCCSAATLRDSSSTIRIVSMPTPRPIRAQRFHPRPSRTHPRANFLGTLIAMAWRRPCGPRLHHRSARISRLGACSTGRTGVHGVQVVSLPAASLAFGSRDVMHPGRQAQLAARWAPRFLGFRPASKATWSRSKGHQPLRSSSGWRREAASFPRAHHTRPTKANTRVGARARMVILPGACAAAGADATGPPSAATTASRCNAVGLGARSPAASCAPPPLDTPARERLPCPR